MTLEKRVRKCYKKDLYGVTKKTEMTTQRKGRKRCKIRIRRRCNIQETSIRMQTTLKGGVYKEDATTRTLKVIQKDVVQRVLSNENVK